MTALKDWLMTLRGKISAGLGQEYSAACGLYEDEDEYAVALVRGDGKPTVCRRFKKENIAEDFARFLESQRVKPEATAGAILLPGVTLLDCYEEELGTLREEELKEAAGWSLMTRETVMERQIWWAAAPVKRDEVPTGIFRLAAISREDGEGAAALCKELKIEPLAVFVIGTADCFGEAETGYRIGVPELQGESAGETIDSSEMAAMALWADIGGKLPEKYEGRHRDLTAGAAMNFLPEEERPERYRWKEITAALLSILFLLLGGFFLRSQQELKTATDAFRSEEAQLNQMDTQKDERKQMIALEKQVRELEADAARLTAYRRPVAPTLEALGVHTPAGVVLTEISGGSDGLVTVKGEARSRELAEKFMETYRQRMNPGTMRLKSISEAGAQKDRGSFAREFVIIIGEEKQQ